MSVAAEEAVNPLTAFELPRAFAGLRYSMAAEAVMYQGAAAVIGDGTGGTATATLLFPGNPRFMWWFIKLSLSAPASVTGEITVREQYRTGTGSWQSHRVQVSTQNNGLLNPNQSRDMCRSLSPVIFQDGDPPSPVRAEFLMSNAAGTTFRFQALILRMNRDAWSETARAMLAS